MTARQGQAGIGALVICLGLLCGGCLSVKPVVLDRKTQLENQILGTFQRLEQDLVLASSVRGAPAARRLSPLQREALEALMIREFNRDDVEELKAKLVVGEANNGLLAVLVTPKDAAEARRVKRLVQEENHGRLVIMKRVIQLSRDLQAKDLPLVRDIFYRLNVQTIRPGEMLQQKDGKWIRILAKAS